MLRAEPITRQKIISIFHFVPSHVFEHDFQGSYKDVDGRVRFFRGLGVSYHLIKTEGDRCCLDLADADPTYILVEYTRSVRLINNLRLRFPGAFIGVRAINIEPLQHAAAQSFKNILILPKIIYGMLRLLSSDISCKVAADALYPISDWEKHVYWDRLPGGARVDYLPYFTPQASIGTPAAKQDLITCLPGGGGIRRHDDLISRFVAFAERIRTHDAGWRFSLTGDLRRYPGKIPSWVEQTGHIEDLGAYLARARAVAILSPLGYGFKTTITDALANRCWPIIHPILYKRCPPVLQSLCVEADIQKSDLIPPMLARIGEPVPRPDINEDLKQMAYELLERDYTTRD